ncbi:MAG TPA: hypothetical protein DCM05_09175 [Elusimicrobia bacterium]|nr:hypothetical protein [Elusimicrobiota bacterium]
MGNIRLRNKIWWIDYRHDGRRIRESVGPSKSLAQKVLAKRETEIAEGRFFPQKRSSLPMTFSQMAEKWWQLHGKHLQSRSTRYLVDKLLSVLGDKRLHEIQVDDLQRYYNLRCEDSSPSTANKYLALISEIYSAGERWNDFNGRNPTRGVRKQRCENPPERFLTESEVRALLSACHSRIFPIVACALMTGMRRGEILGMRWEHIDLERNLIYILRSKSGKRREIPLAPKLKDLLLSLGPCLTGPVFSVPVITLRRYFKRALKASGIAVCRFHDLRHTFASHFLMRTGNFPTLQRVLGHASPRMTQRYAHLAQDYMQNEMLRFDQALQIGLELDADGHKMVTNQVSA